MYKHFLKRLFDFTLSLIGLLILLLPMLIVALIIKLESPGPAIFVQMRAGKGSKPFKFYKFRSMRTDAPHDMASREIKSENYITKFGNFIRKTSIDELPQLINILKGDMSIIGPRPVVLSETDLIENRRATGADSVRPGITGLAQVTARDNLIDMKLKAEIDGEYVKTLSFATDFKIFFKTIRKVLLREDIAEGNTAQNKAELSSMESTSAQAASPAEQSMAECAEELIEALEAEAAAEEEKLPELI